MVTTTIIIIILIEEFSSCTRPCPICTVFVSSRGAPNQGEVHPDEGHPPIILIINERTTTLTSLGCSNSELWRRQRSTSKAEQREWARMTFSVPTTFVVHHTRPIIIIIIINYIFLRFHYSDDSTTDISLSILLYNNIGLGVRCDMWPDSIETMTRLGQLLLIGPSEEEDTILLC